MAAGYVLEYYRTRSRNPKQRWGWRLKYRGKKTAGGGEGYARKDHAMAIANKYVGHLLDEDPIRRAIADREARARVRRGLVKP